MFSQTERTSRLCLSAPYGPRRRLPVVLVLLLCRIGRWAAGGVLGCPAAAVGGQLAVLHVPPPSAHRRVEFLVTPLQFMHDQRRIAAVQHRMAIGANGDQILFGV